MESRDDLILKIKSIKLNFHFIFLKFKMNDGEIMNNIRIKSLKYVEGGEEDKEKNLLDLLEYHSSITEFLKANRQYINSILFILEVYAYNHGDETEINIEEWKRVFKNI